MEQQEEGCSKQSPGRQSRGENIFHTGTTVYHRETPMGTAAQLQQWGREKALNRQFAERPSSRANSSTYKENLILLRQLRIEAFDSRRSRGYFGHARQKSSRYWNVDSCGLRLPAKKASRPRFLHSHASYDELMAANMSPWNWLSTSGTPMCGLQRNRKDTVGGTAALFPVTKFPTHHSVRAGAQSAVVPPRGHRCPVSLLKGSVWSD